MIQRNLRYSTHVPHDHLANRHVIKCIGGERGKANEEKGREEFLPQVTYKYL
jgi:hypothetical protein